MKKKLLKIHKILGLVTGLVVFIVSVTGCLWVFKEEIESLTEDEIKIEIQNKPIITATQARIFAKNVFPDKSVHGTVFGKPGTPIEVIFYQYEPEFYQSVFLHPYTGEVLKVKDRQSGFFAFVIEGHRELWLPDPWGGNIVGISVLMYLIILLTGIYLWWPRGKKKKQKFIFDWKKSFIWKRKNYDLHTILGFYVCLFAFIIAFTGSVMAYDWFYFLAYKGAGGNKAPQFIIPESEAGQAVSDSLISPIDRIIPALHKENSNAVSFELHYPATDSSSIYVEVSNKEGVYYNSDYRFFDQYTMKELETPGIYGKYENTDFADKMIRMNYDIHVGAIGGLLGKIIAFLVSLLSATLPVTGYLLWYGKRPGAKRKE